MLTGVLPLARVATFSNESNHLALSSSSLVDGAGHSRCGSLASSRSSRFLPISTSPWQDSHNLDRTTAKASNAEPSARAASAAAGHGGGAGAPAQGEMPFAVVEGEPVTELPRDLYIPPYALEVFLEAFEGPLDLLLYLIRRQNLDILDIPIAEISRQYVQYIELMKEMQFELAGEYLVMAATLAEIKSRMLLPRSSEAGGRRGRSARRARAPPAGIRAIQAGGRGHRRARAAGARRAPGERGALRSAPSSRSFRTSRSKSC